MARLMWPHLSRLQRYRRGVFIPPIAPRPVAMAQTSTVRARVGLNINSQTPGNLNLMWNDLFRGGDIWSYRDGTGNHWLQAANLDANGWVNSMPAGAIAIRKAFNMPASKAQQYLISWTDTGMTNGSLVLVNGTLVGSVDYTARTATVTWNFDQTDGPVVIGFEYAIGDPTHYPKNFTVTPVGDSNEFTAKFLADIAAETAPNSPLRVMKMTGAEGNANNQAAFPGAITYVYSGASVGERVPNDGVDGGRASAGETIEALVSLANATGRDLWDTVDWNITNTDYDNRFAYVRDNLDPALKYYCEVSNEVWNGTYDIFWQARAEATAEGLLSSEDGVNPGFSNERLIEKTIEVMGRASTVFALPRTGGGPKPTLKRVFAMQNTSAGYWANKFLAYMNLYQHIDVISSSVYFFQGLVGSEIANTYTGDPQTVFDAARASIDQVIGWAREIKLVAAGYNVDYAAYEAGQSLYFNDATYRDAIQRDSRMYTTYRYFLDKVERDLGQVPFCLFVNVNGASGTFGAWGHLDRSSQPISIMETPKAAAASWYVQSANYFPLPLFDRALFKRWDGSDWLTAKTPRYWSGSAWVKKPLKIYNGIEFMTVTVAPEPLTFFDSANSHADITISNSNLTGNRTGAPGNPNISARMTHPIANTSNAYAEYTLDNSAGSMIAGVSGLTGWNTADFIGAMTQSVGILSNVGQIFYGSGNISTGSTPTWNVSGSVVGVLVKNNKLYFGVNTGSGRSWANSADPDAETGGIDLSGKITGSIYLGVTFTGVSGQFTINPGTSAFVDPIPAGAVAWDSAA